MSACRLYISQMLQMIGECPSVRKIYDFSDEHCGYEQNGCASACMRQTDMCLRHVNAPASPGNRRFHGLLPERNMNVIFLRGLSLG